MVSLLISLIVVLIVVSLLMWAVSLLPLPAPFGLIVQVLIILVAVIVILDQTGVLARGRV